MSLLLGMKIKSVGLWRALSINREYSSSCAKIAVTFRVTGTLNIRIHSIDIVKRYSY